MICIVVSYAIGVAEPTSISVNTFGTSTIDEEKISDLIREHFDLRPRQLINMLDLKRPIGIQNQHVRTRNLKMKLNYSGEKVKIYPQPQEEHFPWALDPMLARRTDEHVKNVQKLGENVYSRLQSAEAHNIRSSFAIFHFDRVYEFNTGKEMFFSPFTKFRD